MQFMVFGLILVNFVQILKYLFSMSKMCTNIFGLIKKIENMNTNIFGLTQKGKYKYEYSEWY